MNSFAQANATAKQDAGAVWSGGDGEIFVDPVLGRRNYFHFVVDPSGHTFTERKPIRAFASGWKVKTHTTQRHGPVEAGYLLSERGGKPRVIGLNPPQAARPGGLSCWSARLELP